MVLGRRMQVWMTPEDAAEMRLEAAQRRAHRASRTRKANAALEVYKAGRGTAEASIEAISSRVSFCRVRRDIGLRASLLVPFRFEMPAKRCLAARISTRLEFLRHLLQNLDVRRDALGLNRPA